MSALPAPPAGDHRQLVDQLRDAVGRASELVARLSATFAAASLEQEPIGEPGADLGKQLDAAREDVQELSDRLVETEHQVDRLMSLYVATYQLHAFLDPRQVHGAIADVAVNLLGAARFALLLRKEDSRDCDIVFAEGIDESAMPAFAGPVYAGGDGPTDAALADGVLQIGPFEDSETIAAVPLRIQDQIVGTLVVLQLFDHKPSLKPDDRDLLDLLSAHAASALFAARLFAAKDRKLRTLESLVRLARGE